MLSSFSNDDGDGDSDGDGNENGYVKKAIGFFLSKNNNFPRALSLVCTFLCRPLDDYGVKLPNCTFYGGRKRVTTNFPLQT